MTRFITLFALVLGVLFLWIPKVNAQAVCGGYYNCCGGWDWNCPAGCTNETCPGQCTSECTGGKIRANCDYEPFVCPGNGCCAIINGCNLYPGDGGPGCSFSCSPQCAGKVCGQSNGCGGNCSSSGFSTWSGWSCGACYNPGGCGNVELLHDCSRTNLCNQTEYATFGCGTSTCNECGPTYGAWGACTAPGFSRSRPRYWDCQADDTQSEACRGSVSGTFFDASLVDTCVAYASQPPIEGIDVTLTAQVNHSTAYSATTNSSGNYTRSNLPIPETYDLTYTLPVGARYVENPPKLLCNGSLSGISMTTQGQAVTRRVGLWRIFGGWFQTEGGSVYGNDGILMTIPGTCQLAENAATCNNYNDGSERTPIVVAGAGGTSGAVYYGDGDLELGGGGTPSTNAVVSEDGFNAASAYSDRQTGFDYFDLQSAQFQNTQKTDWSGTGKPAGASNGLYNSTNPGTLTIDSAIDPAAAETIVVFHDGDVSITGNITVPEGSYLAIIASGTIQIESNVTSVQGVYIADGNFEVLSTGDETTEQRFVGEGTFVGLTGVSLLRDRGITNNSESSEYFIFRPDFVVNAPFGLKLPQYIWREIAP